MTTAWPDARKTVELRAKLSSLSAEFDHWRRVSEEAERLRKHHSQILRVTGALDALRKRIDTELATTPIPRSAAGTDRGIDLERMILDVHRIWEFFRSKLSQRFVPWFEPFLVAADQYAWDCYDPVRQAVEPSHVTAEDIREPPLVYFNGGWSPFTLSRGIAYEAEFVPDEALPQERYRDVLESLPFPVIGVPWYQVAHLPDVVLLAHEVGHAVEDDFRLTDRLEALLLAGLQAGKVSDDHRPGWSAWLGEVFADVFGVLGGGPAFASALLDLVAGPGDRLAEHTAGPGRWDIYPPAALRAHVVLAALEAAGFGNERVALDSRWKTSVPHHAMQAFEPDAKAIVTALMDTPIPELRNGSLRTLLPFAAQATAARNAAQAVANGMAVTTTDTRALLAYARSTYDESPEAYASDGVERIVLTAIGRGQDPGVRARPLRPNGSPVAGAPPAAGRLAGGQGGPPRAGEVHDEIRDPTATQLADDLFERLVALQRPPDP